MGEVVWTGGVAHWTHKGGVRLFLWEKQASPDVVSAGTILFVHGSSMASQPTFDLHVPGRPHSSAMDLFRARGFDFIFCIDTLACVDEDVKKATLAEFRRVFHPETAKGFPVERLLYKSCVSWRGPHTQVAVGKHVVTVEQFLATHVLVACRHHPSQGG